MFLIWIFQGKKLYKLFAYKQISTVSTGILNIFVKCNSNTFKLENMQKLVKLHISIKTVLAH